MWGIVLAIGAPIFVKKQHMRRVPLFILRRPHCLAVNRNMAIVPTIVIADFGYAQQHSDQIIRPISPVSEPPVNQNFKPISMH